MFINDIAYLPTDKLYQTPHYEAYTEAKNQYILRSIPGYANYSDDQNQDQNKVKLKWSALINAFIEALDSTDMSPIERQELKIQLTRFKKQREDTTDNENNLNLRQCVNYFENFYFLYTTTNPEYKLSDASKKNLLNAIKESIGVCETGINSRFRAVLQEYKKDNDWIKNELTKARCNTLHILHLQYEQNRQAYLDQFARMLAEDTHNVHTLNTIITSANKADLGITIEEEILDGYAFLFPEKKIKAYFQKHYPALFRTYENQSVETLTNYYLEQLASTLGINNADWAADELNIPSDALMNIQASLDGHFQGISISAHCLGELSDDGTYFRLKTKHDVEVIIKQSVRKKLVVDGYYVSLDDIVENPDAHQNIRIKKGIKRNDLLAVHRAFEQPDPGVMRATLKQHMSIFIDYPELALSQLHKNPARIATFPVELRRDTRFTDVAVSLLNEELGQALSEDERDQALVNQLQIALLALIQSETGYMQELSESVRNFIAPKLNPMLSADFDWNKAQIETQEFIAQVNQLDPSQLLNIIEQRKQAGLAPLPFFEDEEAIHDLKKFNDELQSQLSPHWDQPYLSIRRRACEQANFSWLTNPQNKKNAVTYLAQTNTWFAGFKQYHAYPKSLNSLWQNIILIAKACFRLTLTLLRLGIMYAAFTWLLPMIAAFIQPIFWPLFWIGLAFLFSDNIPLTLTGLGLWFVAFLYGEAWVFFGLGILGNTIQILYDVYDIVDALFSTLIKSLEMIAVVLTPLGVNADRNNTLENTCENLIVRLDSIDASSAQDKSDVLRTLLSRIREDARDETEAEARPTFAELLERKYSLFYHGEEHEVSFSEVSRMRRGYDGEFKLEETSSIMRFFSGRTTSEAVMATAEAASLAA